MQFNRKLFLIIAIFAMTILVSAQAPAPSDTVLVVAQSTDVTSLDPPQIGSRPDANIAHHLFSTLYGIDVDGNIFPVLAESYEISEDGTTYTFTLREGLTCHDGSPLTSDDVAFSFNRAADPENAFTGNTPGFVYSSMGFVDAESVSELEVAVNIARRTSIALGLITEVSIYCRESYDGVPLEETALNPVGSGPYVFVERVADDYILMEKWEDYALYDEDQFETIVWRVIPEASTRVAELIAGNVDIITNVLPDQHDAVDASGVAEIQAV
ncbi:MAG: ABC transporter substrate-binding protein, partial [Anaerolineae bacterium]